MKNKNILLLSSCPPIITNVIKDLDRKKVTTFFSIDRLILKYAINNNFNNKPLHHSKKTTVVGSARWRHLRILQGALFLLLLSWRRTGSDAFGWPSLSICLFWASSWLLCLPVPVFYFWFSIFVCVFRFENFPPCLFLF